jgi:hypothetical protein
MAPTMSGFLGGLRRPVLLGALAGLVWALVAPAAGAAPPTAAKLRREADRMIAAGVPGVVVLVRDGSRTVRLRAGRRASSFTERCASATVSASRV